MYAKTVLSVLLESIDAIVEQASRQIHTTLCLCAFATLPLFHMTENFTLICDDPTFLYIPDNVSKIFINRL